MVVAGLWLTSACGSKHSGLLTATGDGGSDAGSDSNGADEECERTSNCDDQVCSPDGRCIDCYDDDDCRAGQHCDDEQCVADSSGDAGSSSGATTGMGGSAGNAGSGNAGQGGVGGTPPVGSCEGARVLFVIQRSGAMFELPAPEENYWTMVKDAIAGPAGAAAAFETKLDLGALFLVRLSTAASCPSLSVMQPTTPAMASLDALFDQNLQDYTAQKLTDKMDAPVAEAVTAAANLLTGPASHIVLITTAVPDTCTLADSNCATDATIKAVQGAQALGVTTHVIGLGDTPNLDYLTTDGYESYLAQLANAGVGQPVLAAEAFPLFCPAQPPQASYSAASGQAKAHQAFSSADIKTAVSQILSSICP